MHQALILALLSLSVPGDVEPARAISTEQPAAVSAPSSGLVIEPKSGVRYRQIPSGSFTMGCVPGDDGCNPNELPRHRVAIRRFLLAATETTNEQYRRCVAAGACTPPSERIWYDEPGPSPEAERRPPRHSHPVVGVTWQQAASFCRWAGGRLPSEAEWEYAARGGRDGLRYPWGDTLSHTEANYGKERCCGGLATGRDRWKHTAPVASFGANGFGLFDMTGNVWEWVDDWFDRYSSSVAPNRFGPRAQRVLRGGSWYVHPAWLRVSHRGGKNPSRSSSDYGFRCARDVSL